MSNVLFDWRIRDIERTANEAKGYLLEINTLRSDVDRLEHSVREARAETDGVRIELSAAQDRLNRLENAIDQMAQHNQTLTQPNTDL